MPMTDARRTAARCVGPVSRRSFLQWGALGLGGLNLADAMRLRAAASGSADGHRDLDTSVIFIWLPGGPPHMETYDMKPDAPEEYRGCSGRSRPTCPASTFANCYRSTPKWPIGTH